VQKAAAEATTHQRELAAVKGGEAIAELAKLGIVFTPMAKAERDSVRKEMETRLWAGFAKGPAGDQAAVRGDLEGEGVTAATAPGASPLGFGIDNAAGRWLAALLTVIEHLAGLVLAVDVLVVFASVIFRYFLHNPVDWAEEIARALMVTQVFLGAATVLARASMWASTRSAACCRKLAPGDGPAMQLDIGDRLCGAVPFLLRNAWSIPSGQTTPIGLPQWIYVCPVVVGSFFMTLFGVANALNGEWRTASTTLAGCVVTGLAIWGWNTVFPEQPIRPWFLLAVGFLGA